MSTVIHSGNMQLSYLSSRSLATRGPPLCLVVVIKLAGVLEVPGFGFTGTAQEVITCGQVNERSV
jgi:hypothetical protein